MRDTTRKSTFSIVAVDLERGEVGCAVQSRYFAVGAVVPWVRASVGAVATQAAGVAVYGKRVLEELEQGTTPDEALERVLADDPQRETRQLGVVTANGEPAAFTGSACLDWAGHRLGAGFAVQGNILAGEAVLHEMARAFEETLGPLAGRLVAALEAGQAAGGDRRGQQSAALLVVERGGGYAGLSDVLIDLRVDDHAQPIAELARLHDQHSLLFGKTERWVDVDDALRAEMRERLAALGYDGELEQAFTAWVGTENLEERADGVDRIDAVVLDELRRR